MAAKPSLKSVEATAEAPATAAPKKKGKKLLIIALILLLLLGGGGGAAWYFLMGPGAAHPEAAEGEEGGDDAAKAKQKEAEDAKVVFVPMDLFTVNLQGEGDHYLQVTVVLEVTEESVTDTIKQRTPVIRNKLLMLLSSKSPQDLTSLEGKQKLAAEILNDVRQSLPAKTEDRGIRSVLFNSLIIQ